MNKKTTIFLLALLFLAFGSNAQFNPLEAKKSLVKVYVTKGNEAGVSTGFIWKRDNWIVTSLHGMQPGGKIEVVYLDKYWTDAVVKKVYQPADLVLLKVEGSIPEGVVPITEYNESQIPHTSSIHAIGYNNGAKGASSRLLTKGFVDPPETLETLIPPKDREDISRIGFPSLNLEIIYLDGSLLPGYSGSPIYNNDGEFVGIGNGGLEMGQSNVSWVIPAKFLRSLENSSQIELPSNIERASQAFSAQVKIKVDNEETLNNMAGTEDLEEMFYDEYGMYEYSDFEFYFTKNRSFEEMYSTSPDPENLYLFAEEFESYGLQLDYDFLRFEVYEDINNGVVLVIPEEYELTYDPINDVLIADMAGTPGEGYFQLIYAGAKDDFSNTEPLEAVEILLASLDQELGASVGGFTIDENYTYDVFLDDDTYIAWVLQNGNNYFVDDYGYQYVMVLYTTILLSNDKLFYVLGMGTLPVGMFDEAFISGIDCVNNYEADATSCDFFESYMKVMSAAHMTTFAGKQIVRSR